MEKTLESPLNSKEMKKIKIKTSVIIKKKILKEINPEYSLEGLMLKLNFRYFGHLMWIADSLEKTQMLERLRAKGESDGRRWLDSIT